MPRLNAANRAHTTLDGALNDSTTSIAVVDASVFSDPPFRAVIDPEGAGFEIVEVSTISANELTVTGRGVLPFPDDTDASAHDSGVTIAQMQTAGWSAELSTQDVFVVSPGSWVIPGWAFTTTATGLLGSGEMAFTPVKVAQPLRIDRIAVHVSTGGSGEVRLGVYTGRPDNHVLTPDALVFDAGVVDVSTTGVKSREIDEVLPPGYYYLVAVTDVNVTLTIVQMSAAVHPFTGAAPAANGAAGILRGVDGQSALVAGGLPATAPASPFGGGIAPVRLRLAP